MKNLIETPNSYIFNEWNSFSRIAVRHIGVKLPPLWGPSPQFPRDTRVEIRYATIDGAAGSPAHRFDGDLDDLTFLRYDVIQIPARDT